MNSPSTMAQPQAANHPAQQRPQFTQSQYNQLPRDFQAPNGRSNSFGATSPQAMPNYSSPSPHQFSPNMSQAPPPKRPRLSPDAPSPFSNAAFSPVGTPQGPSPVNGTPTNATPTPQSRPGLMAPPQRPLEKEDRSYDDILSGTGINIEEEQRNLTRNDYYTQASAPTSFQTAAGSFDSYQSNSFGHNTNGSFSGADSTQSTASTITPEQALQRDHERANWEAARHSQHPLWDMFLFGGTLNDRLKKISQDEHMTDSQTGVLVNTQKNAPPPVVRVNGLEGASRVIDKGQSILDTRDKAERLSEILKLVSSAAKARLSGILSTSARLSFERREHSKGRVPDEWAAMAAVHNEDKDGAESGANPANSTSHKRTHSQANSEAASQPSQSAGQHPAIATFDLAIQNARAAEEARLAKRAKRLAAARSQDNKDGENNELADQMATNAAAETEKKTTKKERKIADAKLNEQQQHKSANEAARMATSGLIGRGFGGKKSKSYSWMTGAGGGGGAGAGGSGGAAGPSTASAATTPGRETGTSANTPVTGTPAGSRPPVVPRGRRFVQWDEENDKGIQARDILSVLESDGKAARSYVRGCSLIDA